MEYLLNINNLVLTCLNKMQDKYWTIISSDVYIRSLNLITNTETPAACGSDDPTAACEHQSKITMSPACPGRFFYGF